MAVKIVIDPNKCSGCGACTYACKHKLIKIIQNKATITDSSLCDKLGDCLPACPLFAIKLEEENDC